MECTVAVELCEKEEPPPHPENNGSTKNMKIRTEEEVDNGSEMISEEGRDKKETQEASDRLAEVFAPINQSYLP